MNVDQAIVIMHANTPGDVDDRTPFADASLCVLADRDDWREKAKQLHLALAALTDAHCENGGVEHYCFTHEKRAPCPHVRARELLGIEL